MKKKEFIEFLKPMARAIFVENQFEIGNQHEIGRYMFISCECTRRINKNNVVKHMVYQDTKQNEDGEYPTFAVVVNERTTKDTIITTIKDVIVH